MIVKRLVFSVLTLLLLAGVGVPQSKASLSELAWLGGCWQAREGTALIEEIWSQPLGRSMIGLGRTVKGNRTVSFEFMQLREESGSLVFLPQPGGGAVVSFPLRDLSAGKATFENLKHDFPQRVIYERKGKALMVAAIEGTQNGKTDRQEFVMRKVSCG